MSKKSGISEEVKLGLRYKPKPQAEEELGISLEVAAGEHGDPEALLRALQQSVEHYRNSGRATEEEMPELEELEQKINTGLDHAANSDYRRLAALMLFIGHGWGFFESAEGWQNNLSARFSNQAKASKDRLGGRSELKAKILALMAKYKANDTDFSTFMSAWRREPLEGLRLERVGNAEREQDQKYRVIDDSPGSGGSEKEYTYKTLQSTLWAQSFKKQ